MAIFYQELRSLPIEKLIQLYDRHASSNDPTLEFYLTEIHRRDQNRQTNHMLLCTYWIAAMTLIMTIATIVNVCLSFKFPH